MHHVSSGGDQNVSGVCGTFSIGFCLLLPSFLLFFGGFLGLFFFWSRKKSVALVRIGTHALVFFGKSN